MTAASPGTLPWSNSVNTQNHTVILKCCNQYISNVKWNLKDISQMCSTVSLLPSTAFTQIISSTHQYLTNYFRQMNMYVF